MKLPIRSVASGIGLLLVGSGVIFILALAGPEPVTHAVPAGQVPVGYLMNPPRLVTLTATPMAKIAMGPVRVWSWPEGQPLVTGQDSKLAYAAWGVTPSGRFRGVAGVEEKGALLFEVELQTGVAREVYRQATERLHWAHMSADGAWVYFVYERNLAAEETTEVATSGFHQVLRWGEGPPRRLLDDSNWRVWHAEAGRFAVLDTRPLTQARFMGSFRPSLLRSLFTPSSQRPPTPYLFQEVRDLLTGRKVLCDDSWREPPRVLSADGRSWVGMRGQLWSEGMPVHPVAGPPTAQGAVAWLPNQSVRMVFSCIGKPVLAEFSLNTGREELRLELPTNCAKARYHSSVRLATDEELHLLENEIPTSLTKPWIDRVWRFLGFTPEPHRLAQRTHAVTASGGTLLQVWELPGRMALVSPDQHWLFTFEGEEFHAWHLPLTIAWANAIGRCLLWLTACAVAWLLGRITLRCLSARRTNSKAWSGPRGTAPSPGVH